MLALPRDAKRLPATANAPKSCGRSVPSTWQQEDTAIKMILRKSNARYLPTYCSLSSFRPDPFLNISRIRLSASWIASGDGGVYCARRAINETPRSMS